MKAVHLLCVSLTFLFAKTSFGADAPTLPPSPAEAAQAMDQAPFLAAALSEVFTDSRAFSATAVLQTAGDKAGQGIPLGFATLNGNMRWFLNLDQARSSRLEPELVGMLRDAKLSQVLLIMRPKTNAILAVPGLKQWFEFPLPKSEALTEKAGEKVGFLQKNEVARETVEGHPCVKYRLSLPKDRGSNEQAFVWQATDMKNFPIKFQTTVNGEPMTLTFRQVNQSSPDPRHFEAPAGYTNGGGPEALMQRVLMGALGGAGLGGLGSPSR